MMNKEKKTKHKPTNLLQNIEEAYIYMCIYIWDYVLDFTADLNQNFFMVFLQILTCYIK